MRLRMPPWRASARRAEAPGRRAGRARGRGEGAEAGSAGAAGAPSAEREQSRWQRVVTALPSLRVAERRAVGASAQVLRFERPLSRAQAQALAAQMAQDPEVAWAVPNTRERRLQAAGRPPN